MKRVSKIIKTEILFIWLNVKAMSHYKISYFLSIFYELMDAFTSLLYFYLVFCHSLSIVGWTLNKVLALTLFSYLINAIYVMFFIGIASIPEYIQSGAMDLLLIKPINKRFILTFRRPNSVQIINVIIALSLFLSRVVKEGIAFQSAICFVLAALISLVIMHSVLTTIVSISFWTVKIGQAWTIVETMNSACSRPKDIYPKAIKIFLTLIIPSILIIYTPVDILFSGNLTLLITHSIPTMLVFYSVSRLVLNLGIKHYTSAGG